MYNDGGLYAFLAIFGAFMFVFIILGIVCYVLAAIGLMKLAQNRGIENPWLAWIPIANLYILGKIAGTVSFGSFEVPSLELVLPIGSVAVAVLNAIPVIGTILSLAFAVLTFMVLYKLFKMYRPQSAVVWLVLSIVLFFMGPIFIFIMRNDNPVQS